MENKLKIMENKLSLADCVKICQDIYSKYLEINPEQVCLETYIRCTDLEEGYFVCVMTYKEGQFDKTYKTFEFYSWRTKKENEKEMEHLFAYLETL